MTLPNPHARSVAATLGTAEETLRRMAAVAAEGRSPVGAPLAPLDRGDCEAVLAELDELRGAMQACRSTVTGAAPPSRIPGRGLTVGWLAMLHR